MVPLARLNPEAPEFFPNHLHKQLSISWHSPNPLQVHHQCIYYPLTAAPLIWTHQQLNTYLSPSEAETNRFINMADETVPLEVQQQQQQQKKEVIVGDSKGFVQKQLFKSIINCGKMEGRRSLQAYAWRKKGNEVGVEQKKNDNNNKCGHLMKNRQHSRDHQYFRAFPKKKRSCPGVPVRPDGDQTTVMIRNIPSKYTRDMLVEFLDNHCMRENARDNSDQENGEEDILAFDFVYLPIDFRSGFNKGYAFVNFTKPKAAWKFLLTASHMKWDLFQSHKIREVVAARLQGKEKLEKHFEIMNFPCESEEVLPVCFSPPRDGVIKGNQRTTGKLVKRAMQL